MTSARKILVVDDTPHNVTLLSDILGARDYQVCTAQSGPEALEQLAKEQPDLVLLDVVMPGMSGYDVCRTIRENEDTALLPVVMVTALDPAEERVKGIEAGADDFLSKPINTPELLARVRSLLRIRQLHREIADWNRELEQRVKEQVDELRGLERLRGFFSAPVADLIAGDQRGLLEPHRRRVAVVFADLRGFTAFAANAEPEELMEVLREYHRDMGQLIEEFGGTLERFTGDGFMVFFNDPIEVSDPEARAVKMSIAMRDRVAQLSERWTRLGHDLGFGLGIETGYATLGVIGYEGRWDYAAIGGVTNQSARLCAEAESGQILVSERFFAAVEDIASSEPLGDMELRGLARPMSVHNIVALR